jgi:hypothetical protein
MLTLLKDMLTRWGLNPTARQWNNINDYTDDEIASVVEAINPVDLNDINDDNDD